MNGADEDFDIEMDCLVVGGVADGVYMRMDFEAECIALSRPTHLKPLESSTQTEPEAALEMDTYNVHKFYVPMDSGQIMPFGLAVIENKDPAWAIKQMVTAYIKVVTLDNMAKAQAEADKNTKQ